jgi:hypothetical protein
MGLRRALEGPRSSAGFAGATWPLGGGIGRGAKPPAE